MEVGEIGEGSETVLRRLVEYYESLYVHDTARFYAERLYYVSNTDENLHLLAQCYMREGKKMQAYLLLRDSMWPGNRYLRARCCLDLGKLQEAELALLSTHGQNPASMTAESLAAVPGGASGLYLLGLVCKRECRKEAAKQYFLRSLDVEPTMWGSVTELNEMGVSADLSSRLELGLQSALGVLGGSSGPGAVDVAAEVHDVLQQNENDRSSANKGGPQPHRTGTPAAASVSFNKSALSSSKTSATTTTDLDNRRLAEYLKDGACSPRASISLGMSCLSLRVPFATPGTIAFSQPSSARKSLSASQSRRESDGGTTMRDGSKLGLFSTPNLTPIGAGRVTANATLDMERFDRSLGGVDSLQNTAAKGSAPPSASKRMSSGGGGDEAGLMSPIRSLAGSNISAGSSDAYSLSRLSFSGAKADAARGAGVGGDVGADRVEEHPFKMQRLGSDPTSRESAGVMGAPASGESVAPDGLHHVAALLVVFSCANELLYKYACRECVKLLHCLPRQHFSSGHVQHMLGNPNPNANANANPCANANPDAIPKPIGKSYFEMAEYKPALLALKEMISLEPFRLQGTDILSTTLWHLKRDKELCSLAQQVVSIDKLSPEAWCVVGNSFSRQREPEAAIKFFERATAVDPTFTYAHTLCGHELVASEDLERAQKAFRCAIKCDDRHYNAWYGLGAIYTRQERFEIAEYHFRRALSINSSSSVLRCYLGMVLHYQGTENPHKAQEALAVLEDAVSRDRSNPQLPFQLAHVLITAGRLEEARSVLEHLCEVTPREPPVFSLLGQVCQRLGLNQEAYLYYNTAIDLDPREATNLKSAMANLGADQEEGEDEEDSDRGMHSGEDMTRVSGRSRQHGLGHSDLMGADDEDEDDDDIDDNDDDGDYVLDADMPSGDDADAYFDDITGSPEIRSRGEL